MRNFLNELCKHDLCRSKHHRGVERFGIPGWAEQEFIMAFWRKQRAFRKQQAARTELRPTKYSKLSLVRSPEEVVNEKFSKARAEGRVDT